MRVAGYEFSEGARFQTGAIEDAASVGGHLDHLRQHFKGELTPKDVVDDARNPNSPLHTFFEWDDSAAAEQHRLNQARGLIRSVVAIYVDDVQPAQRMKAFVHIPHHEAPHYRETGHALSRAETRRLVIQRAWRELQAWKQRYQHLQEFAKLFEVADEVEKKIARVGKR